MREQDFLDNDRSSARQAGSVAGPRNQKTGATADSHPVLGLQRTVGNRAVGQVMAAWRDQRAEAEADSVATQAAGSLTDADAACSADQIRTGSTQLPAPLRAALSPLVGDTSRLGVDSSESARRRSDSMGARAFSHEGVISLGTGERSSPDAPQLLMHEAVHAARHESGEDAGGRVLVHAKLRGTREALLSQGGGESTGRVRKAFRKETNWDQILSAMAAYEQMEVSLTSKGKPSIAAMNSAFTPMMVLLNKIESKCLAWQQANGGASAGRKREKWHQKDLQGEVQSNDDESLLEDPRSKAARRQAIAMLLPRVRDEKQAVMSGRWRDQLGLSDASRTGGADKAAAGQMASVDRVVYDAGGGKSFEGYFKADEGLTQKMAGHDVQSGIRRLDPNYGARAVAMYRLDQLLQANVVAKAEFAVHNSRMGVVTEKALGATGNKANLKLTSDEATRAGGDAVSLEDPVLQRCLNKLQVLDAIAGQLDRHADNFYIQTDANGKVTGVTGIDLDMAFGQDMTDPDIKKKSSTAIHYRGVPALIDYDLGQRLLAITDFDIRQAVKGLLSEAEIEATIKRFAVVKAHAQALFDSGTLVKQWDAKTATEGRREGSSKFGFEFSEITNYTSMLADDRASQSKLRTPVVDTMHAALITDPVASWQRESSSLEPSQISAIADTLKFAITDQIVKLAYQSTIGIDEAPRKGLELLDKLLNDASFMASLVVKTQEDPKAKLGPMVAAKISQVPITGGGKPVTSGAKGK